MELKVIETIRCQHKGHLPKSSLVCNDCLLGHGHRDLMSPHSIRRKDPCLGGGLAYLARSAFCWVSIFHPVGASVITGWPFDKATCKMSGLVQGMSVSASVFTLVAIAVER